MRKISRNASFACCATAARDAPVIRRLGDFVRGGGGTKAITAGGLGRDWIYNTSKGGELWGDYAAGVSASGEKAEDSSANSDNFWYAPDVTIMDAQKSDVLKFYGLPLTVRAQRSHRVAVACNDNDACGATAFRFAMREAA